jgi:hypothetical protein
MWSDRNGQSRKTICVGLSPPYLHSTHELFDKYSFVYCVLVLISARNSVEILQQIARKCDTGNQLGMEFGGSRCRTLTIGFPPKRWASLIVFATMISVWCDGAFRTFEEQRQEL